MRPFTLVAAAVLCATALPAIAADRAEIEARYSPTFQPCMDADPSTAGMVQCMAAENEFQDKELNARYRAVMAELNAEQQAKLKAAQRAWIAYRDAWCEAQYDDEWGSLSTVVANNCVMDMTIGRTIDLENYPPGT